MLTDLMKKKNIVTYHLGSGPTSVRALRAILLWRFHLSTAAATTKLPMNNIKVS